jgi:hypothetical protein
LRAARELHERARMKLAFCLTLAACVPSPVDSNSVVGGVGGKADGELATVHFDGGWNEFVDGTLVAGDSLRVAYDLGRLTTCRGTDMGSEVWGITGFASFDGGPATAFAVSRLDGGHVVPVTAELAMPATAHSVAMWFQISNKWGCVAYDSNFNANYSFDIAAGGDPVVLAFDHDWNETQSAALHGGDRAIIHYDVFRLAKCAGSTHGFAAWGVTGYYQVDGQEAHSFPASRTDGPLLLPSDAEIVVPHGRDLALWFEATSIWGCHEWDSDFGANYHFEID